MLCNLMDMPGYLHGEFPIVDTFRTFVACPPTEVRAAFQRIQFLAAA